MDTASICEATGQGYLLECMGFHGFHGSKGKNTYATGGMHRQALSPRRAKSGQLLTTKP